MGTIRRWSAAFCIAAIAVAAPVDAAQPDTVWLADASGLVEVQKSNQAVLVAPASALDARAVVVDRQLDLTWSIAGGSLRAYDAAGLELQNIPLPLASGVPVCLEVDEGDGSVWVGVGSQVWGYTYWGEPQQELTFSQSVLDLEVSPFDGRLWMVQPGAAVALDRANGDEILRITSPSIVSASVNPVTGELWVAEANDLVRYDDAGVESFRASLSGLSQLVAEGDGTLWALRNDQVVRIEADGSESFSLTPFVQPLEPKRLRRDPATETVWVASSQALQRITRGGKILEIIDLGSAGNLRDLAPGKGEKDESGPTIEITSPTEGSLVVAARPPVQIAFDDAGSGVDESTFFLLANGWRLSASCAHGLVSYTCTLDEDLPSGEVTLTAGISDYLGNAAVPAEVTVNLGGSGSTNNAVDPPPGDPDTSPAFYTSAPVDRGVTANKIYVTDSDIESVNTSNGNLVLRIPLGQVYSVGPKLSYQFTLTHNSNVWQEVKIPCNITVPGDPETCQGNVSTHFTVAVPNPHSNAGLGWEIHFGKLYPPSPPQGLDALEAQRWPNGRSQESSADATWLYVAPDGATHQFYGKNDRPGGSGVHYTTDGSYLRLKADGGLMRVEHPDGTASLFEPANVFEGTQFCGAAGVSGCWRLQRREDPYDNRITVSYTTVSSNGVETWTISDSTGRSHKVKFIVREDFTGGGDGVAPYVTDHPGYPGTPGWENEWGDMRRLLSSVDLAAFDANPLDEFDTRVVYAPKYKQISGPPTIVQRGRTSGEQGNGIPLTLSTRILRAVEASGLPAGERFAFDFKTYESPSQVSGKIQEVTLPSHAILSYEYGNWSFPTPCIYRYSDPGGEEIPLRTYRFGIKKKHRDLASRLPGKRGTWTYSNSLFADGPLIDQGPNCSREHYRRTVVDGPLNVQRTKLTRQVFYTSTTEGPRFPLASDKIDTWQVTDNGLPYTKAKKIGSSRSNYLFLSQETVVCNANTPPDVGATAGCAKERERYVRYASEFVRGCYQVLGNGPDCWQANPVKVRERTIYYDDAANGSRYTEQEFKEFNGLGSFRETTTQASWSHLITEKTDYKAGRRRGIDNFQGLAIDAETGYFNMEDPSTWYPQVGQRWVLNEANYTSRTEGGTSYHTDTVYDGMGSLECSRARKNAAQMSAKDVVTKLTLGGVIGVNAGLPIRETHVGGDAATWSVGDVCNHSQGNRIQGTRYLVDHAYEDLALVSSRVPWFGTGSNPFPYLFQAEIDRNTGLPRSEYTISGQRRALFYDQLGRLTSVVPEASLQQATTLLTHHNPTATNAWTRIQEKDGTTTLMESKLTFDDFGRLRQREVLRPRPNGGLGWSKTESDYYRDGSLRYETTLQDAGNTFSTAKRTENLRFDPLGRVEKIRSPYGHVTEFLHYGERRKRTRTWIATTPSSSDAILAGQQRIDSNEFYDTAGRVVETNNPEYATFLTYDPAGNVTSSRRGSQTRTYNYDARGFLTSELHPELGPHNAARGQINYSRDVLGNVRSSTGFGNNLRYRYDEAFRLVEVRDSSNKLWAEYAYGTENNEAQGNYRFGKLVTGVRYNYPFVGNPDEWWKVVEKYGYKGRLGQLSVRTTRLELSDLPPGNQIDVQFSQSWLYDKLGRVGRTIYPSCQSASCTGTNDVVAPVHKSNVAWTQGVITQVNSDNGVLGQYKYHDNLQLANGKYNNGTTYVVGRGRNNLAIPTRIRAVYNAQTNRTKWDTGVYRYDGALNIRKIDTDLYSYDRASRLESASFRADWREVGGSTNHSAAYTYDDFDNVLSRSRDGSAAVPFRYTQSGYSFKNRLLHTTGHVGAPDILYDTRGNMTAVGRTASNQVAQETSFDPLGMPWHHFDRTTGVEKEYIYLYGPGNLRFITFEKASPSSGWVRDYLIRDQNAKPLRRWEVQGWGDKAFTFKKDYVYGPEGLFATVEPGDVRQYFIKDHLGTPRVITNRHGQTASGFHNYYPYGEEISDSSMIWDDRFAKFTGHERDKHGQTDYMLARSYDFQHLRFRSPDPARDGWNLYAYAGGNPIRFVDPNGEAFKDFAVGFGKGLVKGLVVGGIAAAAVAAGPVAAVAVGAAAVVSLGTVAVESYAVAIDPLASPEEKHAFAGEVVGTLVGSGAGFRGTSGALSPKGGGAPTQAIPGKGIRPAPGTRVRPAGVPEGWRIRPTRSKGGTEYYNPKNPNESVRVMQGNPNSPYPNSQAPYARQRNSAGDHLDANGNPGVNRSADTHIPLDKFRVTNIK